MRVSEIRVKRIRVNQGLGVFPLDAYMVWCPTWSKNLGRTLFGIYLGAVAVALGIKDKVIYHKNRLYGTKEIWHENLLGSKLWSNE